MSNDKRDRDPRDVMADMGWAVSGREPAPQPARCPVHSKCADDAYSQCRLMSGHEPKGHSFDPQPAPSGDGTVACEPGCDHCAFQASLTDEERRDLPKMNAALARWNTRRHAPRGDEAKVREIAERWFPGLMDAGMPSALGAVRAAYAAGKADGARAERKAAADEFTAAACVTCSHERCVSYRRASDLIARRGSEGT